MEELIDRIENKISELIQTNEQLREKIRLLSSERDQWVQECSLHEQERQNLNERLEKLLSGLQEASREIALAQHQHHHHIEIAGPLKEDEEQLFSEMEMAAESEEHAHCHHHHHGHHHHG